MPLVVNGEQDELWNGEDGEHWAVHHDRYDTMAEGFNPHLLGAAGLAGDSRVLDIGCGTGDLTRRAARLVRNGNATGIDLSAPMLDRARRLAERDGVGNVTFVRGDAQVHPLPRGGFDVAISRAGVMFFADPVAAFGNVGGALRPGGRLVFLTHSRASERFEAVLAALAEHVALPAAPERPPDEVSFADPDEVRRLLTDAGFDQVSVAPVDILSPLGRDAEDAVDFLFGGPLRPMLADADPASERRARAAVVRELRADEEPGAVRLPAHGWLYSATRLS